MLVKVAPLGERVVDVNLDVDTDASVGKALEIAGVQINGRSIRLNNVEVGVDALVSEEGSIITLVNKMKGGR